MKISCAETAGKAASSSSATQSNLEGEQLPLNHTARVKSNECCIPYEAQLFHRATFLSSAPNAVPCVAGRHRKPGTGHRCYQGPPKRILHLHLLPSTCTAPAVVGCSGVSAGGTLGRCLRSQEHGEPGHQDVSPWSLNPGGGGLASRGCWLSLRAFLKAPKGEKNHLFPPSVLKIIGSLNESLVICVFFKIF